MHAFNDAFHLRDIPSGVATGERINWSAAALREPKGLTEPVAPERAAAAGAPAGEGTTPAQG
jgi:hypothetical protein